MGNITKKYGLEENVQICKTIKVERTEWKDRDVIKEGNVLERVEEFSYLGSKSTNKHPIQKEIGSGQFCNVVKRILWNCNIGNEAKISIYKTYYHPSSCMGQ